MTDQISTERPDKAQADLGFAYSDELSEGLRSLIDWRLANTDVTS